MVDKKRFVAKACQISDYIFSDLVKSVYSFRIEKDIDSFIRSEAKRRKVKLAFPPIVASGKNAANPHHKPNNSRLQGFVVVDFGVKFDGFCSDMTRMLFFGKPSKKELDVYELLLKVQEKAIDELSVGKKYFVIDKNVRTRLGKYKKFFIHSLGHGVGKKVHEKPVIASVFRKRKNVTVKILKRIEEIKNTKIKAGDIVTIEPGIYIKNKFGLRIEDTVVIKKNKVEVLTNSPKYLIRV